MKKYLKNTIGALAALSLFAGVVSCSDGSGDDLITETEVNPTGDGGASENKDEGSDVKVTGETVVFNVTADSSNLEDTVLFVKYDRSAAGADELITIENAELRISVNDNLKKTYNKITFALDEYGSSFSGKTGQLTDSKDMKEYKTKLPIGSVVKKGDVVKVVLADGFKITGAGKNKVELTNVVVALVDKAESVGYYKELVAEGNNYKSLIKVEKTETEAKETKETTDEEKPADSGKTETTGEENTTTATVVKTMAVNVNNYSDDGVAPATDHGIQYTEDMASIPVNAKSGDVWTLKIAGTADEEFRGDMQFVNAAWGGITGESISKTFTTTAFDYEIDFTFSADCSDGKFMLGNAGMDPAVAKTLSLTKYSFTKKSGAVTSSDEPTSSGEDTPAATRSVSGSEITLTVASDAPVGSVTESSPVNVVLQYTRANKDEAAIKIEPASLKIYKGTELVKTVTKIEGFSLNVWGGTGNAFDASAVQSGQTMEEDNCKCFQLKIPLETVTSIAAGDTIKVVLESGTVVGTGSSLADNLRASIVVGDSSLNGWSFTNICTSDSAE